MSRRPSLPGAAELFRSTGGPGCGARGPRADRAAEPRRAPERAGRAAGPARAPRGRRSTVQHRTSSTAATPLRAPSAEPATWRPTGRADARPPTVHRGRLRRAAPPRGAGPDPADPPAAAARRADRRPSGREKHDEKITVYCSAEELFELERARLALRGDHGMVVDRGRIVREAVAVVLADLDAKGESSILVRRLRES